MMKHTIAICNKCECEFFVSSEDIKEATLILGGQAVTLVYFACPECNKNYRVTLKDKRYDELKEDLERIKTRIRKNHGSRNERLARTLNQMVFKKHERIKNHLTNLNNKFTGTFTFVASENNHKEQTIKYLP